MKRTLLIIAVVVALCTQASAQMRTDAETRRQFARISEALKGITPDREWVMHNLPDLPVHYVKGEYCLSAVALAEHGFTMRHLDGIAFAGSQTGRVVTMKIPLKNISPALQIPRVQYLEIAARVQPHLHKLTSDVRADSVWAGINLPQGYTGKGVLIGITDWGFDYGHPMFMDTNLTTSRIRAAWDQFKLSGTPPAGMSYGAEYNTPQALSAALCDTTGTYYGYATHGSHVAGIAGGSGAGTKYRGVAFEAGLLFASQLLDVGSAIDAFNWMKSVADADGKRLVVNMSWGLYYIGTMDGTSLLSQAINNLSAQGVVFVTSAGNNGDVNFHIRKDYNNDSIRTRISFYGYGQHPAMWGQCITMWGEPSNPFGARLEVYNSSGLLLGNSAVFNSQANPGYFDTIMVLGNDTIFYNLTIDDAHPLNARPHMRLRVKNTNTAYRVVLSSFAPAGRVHYWNVVELSNGVGNWGQPFLAFGANGVAGDPYYSLGEPACTEGVITVAAHISESVLVSGTVVPGAKATFSSIGPTYDERMKPDLSAPGVNIVSSINSYTTAQYTSAAQVVHNGRTYHFAAFSGTSMSSPATAGAAAVLLEANPNLSPLQVRGILRETARQDNRTGVITWPGSPAWGMGKVTLTDAVAVALNTVTVEAPGGHTGLKVFPVPAAGELWVVPPADYLNFADYQIINTFGGTVASGKLDPSQPLQVASLTPGIYLLRILQKGKAPLVTKVLVGE
jgi:minor extracellular serine protease Vpr